MKSISDVTWCLPKTDLLLTQSYLYAAKAAPYKDRLWSAHKIWPPPKYEQLYRRIEDYGSVGISINDTSCMDSVTLNQDAKHQSNKMKYNLQ